MGRQLNIRSDEAYEMAHKLAREEGRSVTSIVEEALRSRAEQLDSQKDIFSETAVAQRVAMIAAFRQKWADCVTPGDNSNHDDMYDENGLPI
ncbi:MAG: type II toxin-antitoxin system VapB family antitoxin [Bosea sp. (in: a-proteobacteria)]